MPETKGNMFLTADGLREKIKNGTLFPMIGGKSHTDIHVKKSDVDLMNRLLSREVQGVSAFADDTDAKEMIENVLYTNAGQIAKWRAQAKTGDTEAFFQFFESRTVGRGIILSGEDNTIKEFETKAIDVILRCSDENPAGFDLITAYPCLNTPSVTPTGKDLRPVIKETEHYKNASPTKKAYMEYQTDPKSKRLVTFLAGEYEQDDMLQLNVPTKNPNVKHQVRIKENVTKITTKNNRGESLESPLTRVRDSRIKNAKSKTVAIYTRDPKDETETIIRQAAVAMMPKSYAQINALQNLIQKNVKELSNMRTHHTHQYEKDVIHQNKNPDTPKSPGYAEVRYNTNDRIRKAENLARAASQPDVPQGGSEGMEF